MLLVRIVQILDSAYTHFMKRLALIVLLAGTSLSLSAQIYFRGGAVAHHYNMRTYNKLVDSYNEANPGLTTPMPYQEWMFGPDFGIGKRRKQYGIEFSFRSGKGVISSSGVDSTGATVTRDVQTKEASFCAGIYVRFLQPWPIYMSFDGEISIWSNKTSVNGESYRVMDKGPTILITPGLKWMPFKGVFSPVLHVYYAAPLLDGLQKELWADMDPIGYPDVKDDDFWVKHGHFGVGVSFLIGRQAED